MRDDERTARAWQAGDDAKAGLLNKMLAPVDLPSCQSTIQ
jgi:hypothetical protein